jgi:hypothetical protein
MTPPPSPGWFTAFGAFITTAHGFILAAGRGRAWICACFFLGFGIRIPFGGAMRAATKKLITETGWHCFFPSRHPGDRTREPPGCYGNASAWPGPPP